MLFETESAKCTGARRAVSYTRLNPKAKSNPELNHLALMPMAMRYSNGKSNAATRAWRCLRPIRSQSAQLTTRYDVIRVVRVRVVVVRVVHASSERS